MVDIKIWTGYSGLGSENICSSIWWSGGKGKGDYFKPTSYSTQHSLTISNTVCSLNFH
jgi:hypothetical protein